MNPKRHDVRMGRAGTSISISRHMWSAQTENRRLTVNRTCPKDPTRRHTLSLTWPKESKKLDDRVAFESRQRFDRNRF